MNRNFSILIIAVLLVSGLAIFFSSCNKDDPDPIVATSIELVSGGGQTAIAGTALANPIEVIVKGQNGKVFPGVIIAFAVAEGSLSSATAMTDVAGKASVTWTLGSTYSTQTLIVTAFNAGVALTGSPVTVNATATVPTSVTDIDGNTYPVVVIGNQIWMAENLKTTHYVNGDAILDGTGAGNISVGTETKYWFAYSDDLNNVSTYGRLYTWYTITDSRNVCPDGWHVPTDTDWTTLTTYLDSDAGGKLKETGTTHWTGPNTEATNETGFTALPGGTRFANGTFSNIGSNGYWWSSSEKFSTISWYRSMKPNDSDVYRYSYSKDLGISVRCLRD